jgi:hypothetical protein
MGNRGRVHSMKGILIMKKLNRREFLKIGVF